MKISEIIIRQSFINVVGNTDREVTNIASIFDGIFTSGSLTWVNKKNSHLVSNVHSGIIILEDLPQKLNPEVTYLVSKNPRSAIKKIIDDLYPEEKIVKQETSAFVDPTSIIGNDCYIGHNVVIEKNCTIGSNVVIGSNTVIKHGTVIGNNVVIGSNNTIGGIGFGYQKNDDGNYELIKHIGIVRICDNVEIGNNTCIDRAVLGETFIGSNVKIDNLVHIAHNAKIHSNALIIANAMIAGSCEIGNNTWIAPSSSIINGIRIGNNVVIGIGAVVLKPVENEKIIIGNPGKELIKKV
jgi:UDP-3-O-[3-hydroxymyristoyl] glucosamine N-acyltransferase